MRTKDVQVESLLEVERWFKSEMNKGRFVQSAGIFLSLAVILAVITAVVAAVGREDPHAAVSIVIGRVGQVHRGPRAHRLRR
jgi:hypothetical protein